MRECLYTNKIKSQGGERKEKQRKHIHRSDQGKQIRNGENEVPSIITNKTRLPNTPTSPTFSVLALVRSSSSGMSLLDLSTTYLHPQHWP